MNNILVKFAMVGGLSLASLAANAGTVTFGQFAEFTGFRTFSYLNQDTVLTTGKKPKLTTAITAQAEITSMVQSGKTFAKGSPMVNYTSKIAGKGIAQGETVKAYFSLDASSKSAAINNGTNITQLFDGSVSLIDAITGKDLVTATFTGASLTAVAKASSFTFDANSTSGTLTFASDVYSNLGLVNDFALGGSGLSAPISYSAGHSFNYSKGYQANITGTLSTSVPEPAAIAVLGLGLAGLGVARRRRAA